MGVRVEVTDEAVEIDLDGLDALWALRRHLRLAHGVVASARVAPVSELRAELGWRLGGTYVPGVVAAGNFSVPGRPGARQLWSVYRDPEALVIDTTLERPCRVVLQHPDRHDLAWWIGERLRGSSAQS